MSGVQHMITGERWHSDIVTWSNCSRPSLQGCRYPRQGRDGGEKSRVGSRIFSSTIHSWSRAKTRIQHAVMLGLSALQPPCLSHSLRIYSISSHLNTKQCTWDLRLWGFIFSNSIDSAPLVTHLALDSIFIFVLNWTTHYCKHSFPMSV